MSAPSLKERSDSTQDQKDMREKECLASGPRVFENADAFEASLDSRPICTRALLEKAAEQVEAVRRGEPDPSKQIIRLPHVLGGGDSEIRIPPHAPSAVRLSFCGVFHSAQMKGKSPAYSITPHDKNRNPEFSDTIALKPNNPQNTVRQAARHIPASEEYRGIPKPLETCLLQSKMWASVTSIPA